MPDLETVEPDGPEPNDSLCNLWPQGLMSVTTGSFTRQIYAVAMKNWVLFQNSMVIWCRIFCKYSNNLKHCYEISHSATIQHGSHGWKHLCSINLSCKKVPWVKFSHIQVKINSLKKIKRKIPAKLLNKFCIWVVISLESFRLFIQKMILIYMKDNILFKKSTQKV